jgi:hypothetical protein
MLPRFRHVCSAGLLALSGCGSQPAREQTVQAPPEPPRITQFYASPANPARGEGSLLCYGTERAKTVRLDPPVERVFPAVSYCIEVFPAKKTTYTLTAERDGTQDSKSVTVTPGGAPVRIEKITVSSQELTRGQPLVLCYDTRNAISVMVEPVGRRDTESTRHACFAVMPEQNTTYTITATGADGATDQERVTVRVK